VPRCLEEFAYCFSVSKAQVFKFSLYAMEDVKDPPRGVTGLVVEPQSYGKYIQY